MPANYPGPYELEIGYTVQQLRHVLRVSTIAVGNPNPGDAPGNISLLTRSGGQRTLPQCAADLWNLMRGIYATSVQSDGYTLWKYRPQSFVRDYVTAGTFANFSGASATAPTLASQLTLTARTAAGGIVRIVLLEVSTADTSSRFPFDANGTSPGQRILQLILSTNGFVVGRDNTFPISGLRVTYTQNEAIYKRRYRRF